MSSQNSRMANIRHKILVLSGKGGVGKSTVASQLALSLMSAGHKVGLLDVDLCGPSIPTILGLVGHSMVQSSNGWVPVYVGGSDEQHKMAVMSIGFLLESKDAPVIWRGPKKTSLIRQFLEEVVWGPLDFLIIDTPPGTSDENISVCEQLAHFSPDGAILVTTPQHVSTDDVRKEITFCKQVGIPVLGIVENMSGFVCPCCGEQTNIFSKGGGEALSTRLNLPFIGRIPLDPSVSQSCDQGTSFITAYKESKSLEALHTWVKRFDSELPNSDASPSDAPSQ